MGFTLTEINPSTGMAINTVELTNVEMPKSVLTKKMQGIVERFGNFLIEKGVCAEQYAESRKSISYLITWGDWKHAHLTFDYLAEEFFKAENIGINIKTKVTEEDGSDCYSAIHKISWK